MTRRRSDKVVFLNQPAMAETDMCQLDSLIEKVAYDHEPALRRFLRMRLAGHPDFEDLVQEVFLRLAKQDDLSAKLSKGEASTRSYLFAIAANLVNDRHRTHKIRISHDERLAQEPSARRVDASAEQKAMQQEELRLVRRAIAGLHDDTRDAFVMSRFDSMSYREVAERMGISVSMVQEHIVRALRAIRKETGASY